MKFIWKSVKFLMKGPSSEEKNLANTQAAFYSTMIANYTNLFVGQQNIINSLTSAFEPILAAGPQQKGFSATEEAAMRTGATDVNAANFGAAQRALNNDMAARGGGNIFLPSGAEEQLKAGLLTSEAQTEGAAQNAITQANYASGRQLFSEAANVLGSNAGLLNPTGASGATTGAGSAAGTTFGNIAAQEQAASPWGAIGGLVGGAAGAFLGNPGLFTGAASSGAGVVNSVPNFTLPGSTASLAASGALGG